MKRMTLLAKRDGLATSDFRAYWAGPHAQLGLGMDGIVKYTHNRVEKVLWASDAEPAFSVDGVVELSFSDSEAKRGVLPSSISSMPNQRARETGAASGLAGITPR